MLQGEGCVFRIRIVPKDAPELLVAVDDAKFERLNRWANTLFYRNFQNVVSYEIAGAAGGAWIGLLSFHYTTPEGYAPIVDLTNRYRLLALLIFGLVTAGYGLVVRTLILPVKRVIGRIDDAVSSPPLLMSRPKTMLERAYNSLARDAILLRVGQSLRRAAAGRPDMDRAELLSRVPELLVELLSYRAVVVCDVRGDESGRFTVMNGPVAVDGVDGATCKGHCREHVFTSDNLSALANKHAILANGKWFLGTLARGTNRLHSTCFAVLPGLDSQRVGPDTRQWNLETVAQLSDQLCELFAALDLQRRHVRSERSRANISLARNLGHDLTNIIATSKLDILTARKILDAAGTDPVNTPAHQTMLRESVQGLLDTARLLQEVVNIYRAFSYVNRPKFETRRINAVLDEMIEVFSLSLPSRTTIRRDYAPNLPEWTIEPRLLKLALFNVLNNAVGAIKRRSGMERTDGLIVISTRIDPESACVYITVGDNGPGICTSDGQLATQAEIDNVFRYGVSTKTESGGEGLGLSWVWTIVEEFHNGSVEARNRPDGGAEFVMQIGVVDERK